MRSRKSGAAGNGSDREFMLGLYQEYRGLMFSTAEKFISDPDEREDVVQDSLERLLRHADALRWKERPVQAAYVVQTVRNTAINHLRRRDLERRHMSFAGEDDGLPEPDAPTLEELMDIRERGAHMREILAELSETDRLLLTGKYILGYGDAELAAELGVKTDSIRMMLTRARRRVISAIRKREAEEND